MKISFVGSVGLITQRKDEARKLFVDALALPLEQAEGSDFLSSNRLQGSKYFGVWPLSEAAKVCFGSDTWPADRPIPQAFVEFEVDSPPGVAQAASELESKGYTLLHPPRTDPWGQTVTRLQTEDGVIVGISYVPWMHRKKRQRTRRVAKSRR